VTQLGVGGNFHYDNVRARLMTQFGLYSQTTPRNDASPARGQWNLADAYRYISEAYGGYHFNALHGIKSTPASSCRISACSATTVRQLGLSAFVCFLEHAVVFQRRARPNFSDGALEDRAVGSQTAGSPTDVSTAARGSDSRSFGGRMDGSRSWEINTRWVKMR